MYSGTKMKWQLLQSAQPADSSQLLNDFLVIKLIVSFGTTMYNVIGQSKHTTIEMYHILTMSIFDRYRPSHWNHYTISIVCVLLSIAIHVIL